MRGAVLALTLGLAATAASAIPGLEPGVSRELARWRAQHYRDVRYALAIHIAAGATKLEGTATIDVTLPGSTPDVVLDWRPSPVGARVRELNVNGGGGAAGAPRGAPRGSPPPPPPRRGRGAGRFSSAPAPPARGRAAPT